jgi:hypothetical protein
MEARQDGQSDQIAQLRAEMGEFRAEMRDFRTDMRADLRELRSEMNTKLLWMLGIQLATLLTIVGALVTAAYKT